MGKSIDLGGTVVHLLSGGKNRVDGGGMLGILPKVIWNRWYPADDKNRIWLETHCLLVERDGERILIESGCGNKLSKKERAFYSVAEDDWIGRNLLNHGFDPSDISKVILTHLHTDHAGGVLNRDKAGDLVPTFPNAEVLVSEAELETARAGLGITPNAYNPENYEPLAERGLLRPIETETEVSSGLSTFATPGHTEGHLSVLIEGLERKLVFTGDLLPLAKQVVPQYNMAYDTHPVRKTQTKTEFLGRAHAEEWILVLSHEPKTPVCRVQFDEEKSRYSLGDALP